MPGINGCRAVIHAVNNKKAALAQPVCVEYFKLPGYHGGRQISHEFQDDDVCRIVFCLNGRISWVMSAMDKTSEYTLQTGRFGFYRCPGGCCCASCSSEKECQILQLCFPYAAISDLVEGNTLSPELSHLQSARHFTGMVLEITPPMNGIIGSIKDVLEKHLTADLFIWAKALELLWLFCNSGLANRQPLAVTKDGKAIQKAMRILQNKLDDPPSLGELANLVGMSVSKLKSLFPKTCGLPPYGYLRKMRMERALLLLSQNGMTVTDVAMEVGYSSISHFTTAFRKEFSIYPSQARCPGGTSDDLA